MKKHVLVAAVGAALVAGPIAAQAAATVYGHAHMSIDMLDADVTANEGSSTQVVSNSSRFGIKADESLGGGLKAEVKYELLYNGFGETTGSSLSGNRDNYIGLSGGFGAVRIGTIDGAVKDAGGVADLFYREQLGESRAIINAGYTTGTGSPDDRVPNGIHYFSPSLGGWVIKAQYGYLQEQGINAADNERTTLQLGAKGKIGPVALGIGYASNDSTVTNSTDIIRVGAKATFGGFDVAALYQTASDINGTSGNDQDAYGVGVGFKFGNNYIKGQYYIADDLGSTANSGATQISVGYDYLFSKTTKVYVVYATLDKDGATNYTLGGNGHGTTAFTGVTGGTASGLSAGMIIDF